MVASPKKSVSSPRSHWTLFDEPSQYLLSLASEVNAAPLPAVPEVFGVRLPPNSECLTSVDFDLLPNKPPPGVKIYDEEIEEIEESESSEEEPEPEPPRTGSTAGWNRANGTPSSISQDHVMDAPFPISAIATPSDVDMLGPSAGARTEAEEGSEVDEEGLFAGGDDDDEESDGMEEVHTAPGSAPANGVKRKLVEEDDYD